MTCHEPDWLVLKDLLGDEPLVVDVGANAGQSIHSFKYLKPKCRIKSFEPNPVFKPVLGELAAAYSNVEVFSCGLGRARTTLRFQVPVFEGVPHYEEATSRLEVFDLEHVKAKYRERGTLRFEEFEANVLPGDELNLIPDLIKVDVEGAELDVLEGFHSTIAKHAPVVLAENSFVGEVTAFLDAFSYTPAMADQTTFTRLEPVTTATLNTFYIPPSLKHMIRAA